jgi:ubiquinol-cytochrome c reductase cytochrome b subunit
MSKTIESRLINRKRGVANAIANHVLYYPTPITLNYAWSFGSLVGIFFGLQLFTGIFLAMHYTAHVDFAFESVVHIMTNVHGGYLIRYMHANGASMIFILLYLHMARGLFFRSYVTKRKALWWSGVLIFLLMMATAFIGYVLPWGQMSFWGATVITSLVTAVPIVGENIAYWVWGGFSVSNATLIRFFSIHYLLPFIITGLIFIHLLLLHAVGSSNPVQQPTSINIPFHPYFTIKDTFIFNIVFLIFIVICTYYPNLLGHSDNFIPANPLVTPAHIVPEWYFTPFYAILRACPNKLGGVIGMLSGILVLFALPYFKLSLTSLPPVKSVLYQVTYCLFIAVFLILMFLGGQPAAAPFVLASKMFTLLYFAYFLLFIPFYNFFYSAKANTLVHKLDSIFEI